MKIDDFDKRAAKYTDARIHRFNRANNRFPQVRAKERQCMLDRLNLKDDIRFCDVSAGGGYLADGVFERLNGKVEITCIENSTAFASALREKHNVVACSLSCISLSDSLFDRVACLAGVHHQRDKPAFYAEAFRILKPGGILVIGDVLKGSPQASFLNGPVDIYTDIGHDGMFLEEGELSSQLEYAGFVEIEESIERYSWDFPDEETMILYCRDLFRMTKASLPQVHEAVLEYLPVSREKAEVHLHWQLIFATARKPSRINFSGNL